MVFVFLCISSSILAKQLQWFVKQTYTVFELLYFKFSRIEIWMSNRRNRGRNNFLINSTWFLFELQIVAPFEDQDLSLSPSFGRTPARSSFLVIVSYSPIASRKIRSRINENNNSKIKVD